MSNNQIAVVTLCVIALVVSAIVALVSFVRRRQLEARLGRVSLVRQKLEVLERQAVKEALWPKVEEHLPALMRKYRQTVRQDDYGLVIKDDWEREVSYFLERVVLQRPLSGDFDALLDTRLKLLATLGERDLYHLPLEMRFCLCGTIRPVSQQEEVQDWISGTYRSYAVAVVESMVREAIAHQSADAQFDQSMSGKDFELFCAEELSRAGWSPQVVGASGDQGGDIVAEKAGRRVVLQCKKYSAPVGNAAVQEVFAAMQYHTAEVACVVSNSGYTKAALQLAATTGVHMLHYSELGKLDKIARIPG